MAVVKNEIPILEHDHELVSVIMPNRKKEYQFPQLAVFPFLMDEIEKFAQDNSCEKIGEFESATKLYPIYKVNYRGHDVCMVQAPVGAPAAVQILEYLIGYGATKIISAGSCGALRQFQENEFLVPVEALRDEGTSYHYLPPSRTVSLNKQGVAAVKSALEENGIPYEECKTWTTDGFYRETKDMVEYRKAEGCSVVEMECSALAACAEFRGAVFGQALYTADTLADVDQHDERGWGLSSLPAALKVCLDAVIQL